MKEYLDAAQKDWVRQWWRALNPIEQKGQLPSAHPDLSALGRQARARVRRCASVQNLLLEPATYKLAERLLECEAVKTHPSFKGDYAAVALVAGVLAHVREDANDPVSLAALLGKEDDGRKRMSELRFTQLMRIQSHDDFLRQLRRALQLMGKEINVAMLANDILAWALEKGGRRPANLNDRLQSRWARDYYIPARSQPAKNATTSENPA